MTEMFDRDKTLVLIKPDGVQRGLMGEIISRFERRGLKVTGLKLLQMTEQLADRHYAEHANKPFFNNLVEFITSGPIVAMVLEAPEAVAVVRNMMGGTDPKNAALGTIRGDLALEIGRNVIHGSDSPERAIEEINLFFGRAELVNWFRAQQSWITE